MLGAIAAALLGALAVGCGSSDSSSSSPAATSSADSTSSSAETEPSAEFVDPRSGKNQVAKIGKEASAEEREEASRVLEESMQARATGDWAAQCSTLAAITIEQIEQESAAGIKSDCAKTLESQAQPLAGSASARASTMTGPIDALRVENGEAIALYHGTEGRDFAIPLREESNEWKVGAVVEEELR